MRVEIREKLGLSAEQRTKVMAHSVDNVVNVLVGNFRLVGQFAGQPDLFLPQVERLLAMSEHIDTPDALVEDLRWLTVHHQSLRDALSAAAPVIAAAPEDKRPLAERCARAIDAVLDVVLVRAVEWIARHTHGDAWRRHAVARLRGNFRQVMDAIVRNSLGRYRLVYRADEKAPGDYLLDLDFVAQDGESITMPEVLQDCLRDLVCNARKYSPPGSTIRASLAEAADGLRVSVSDDGAGIAADEIARVVHFGVRGAGASAAPTMGGGYGLTKAWFVTEGLGGRMWIDSELGKGTTITIHLPYPADLGAGAPTTPRTLGHGACSP